MNKLLWAIDIDGACDTGGLKARLSAALSAIVRRHEILRTVFTFDGNDLCTRVQPPRPVEIECEDIAGLPATVRHQRAIDFGMAPYDVASGPLCRFRLSCAGRGGHRLYCGFHHLVTDGGSWRVFCRELAAELDGQNPRSPELQFSDYGAWQRQQTETGAWAQSAAYWRDKIDAAPAPLQLPATRSGAEQIGNTGQVLTTRLPDPIYRSLRETAERIGFSPFRVALAAFAVWLALAAQRRDLRFSTTLTGRSDDTLAGLIGLFVTDHLVDVCAEPETTFRDLVDMVSGEIDTAITHQSYPISVALNDVDRSDHSLDNPFTPVSFTRMPGGLRLQPGGLTLRDSRVFLPVAHRDLAVYFQQINHGAELTWVFRSARLDTATITRASGQLNFVLRQVLADPDRRLADVDIVPPNQRNQAIRHTTGEARAYPMDTALHRLVEAQSNQTPNRIAVVSGDLRLSYSEVDAKANAIAENLCTLGVKKGSLVPLLMPPSAEMLLAELAVLKAGGVFVPLDPGWPPARTRGLLDRLDAPVLMVRSCDAPVPGAGDDKTLAVGDPREILLRPAPEPAPDIGAEDPVYCIFTSGSTGRPKGAINANRGVVNRVCSMSDRVGNGGDHVVLAAAPPAADTLVWQYFWPLICGGRCVIAPSGAALSPHKTAEICAAEGVTLMDFVPSAFQVFADDAVSDQWLAGKLATVRAILIGGEAMKLRPVRDFKSRFPGIAIFNSYGPTEAAISTIFFEVPAHCAAPVPIGRPLPNVTALILARNGLVAPLGQAGELCLAGACVGLGYFGDPEQTAKSFVKAPAKHFGNGTMYRTGDLVRLRPDGLIDYLGRIDDQISLNGNRIEPGEVEAALAAHPDLSEAAAVLQNDANGRARFVAYVVPKPGVEPRAKQLRAHLAGSVPRQMLPGAFFSVPQLPRKASGKLDRNAVTRLTGAVPLHPRETRRGPASRLEADILSVWKSVLGRDDIGPDDDFFLDGGGDSLLALRCALMLEQSLGQRIDLHRFYTNATPSALARDISDTGGDAGEKAQAADPETVIARLRLFLTGWKGEQTGPDSLLFTLNKGGKDRHLFWCFQGFHEFQQLARHLGPDHPLTGMRSGHLVIDYTPTTVGILAQHYADAICATQPEGGLVIGGNCQAAVIMREAAKCLRRLGRQIDLTIFLEDTAYTRHRGRTALLYGAQSHLNPYLDGTDPEVFLQGIYPDGFETSFVPGGHGTYFDSPNIAGLAQTIRDLLKTSRGRDSDRPGPARQLRHADASGPALG